MRDHHNRYTSLFRRKNTDETSLPYTGAIPSV
jgi:hypothetical protein